MMFNHGKAMNAGVNFNFDNALVTYLRHAGLTEGYFNLT